MRNIKTPMRLLVGVVMMLACIITPAWSQSRSDMNTYNNLNFTANGQRQITGPIGHGMNQQIINGVGVLGDTNPWTGTNTFSGNVNFTGQVNFANPPFPIVYAGVVANLAALKAVSFASIVFNGAIIRQGYSTANDGGGATYIPTLGANCTRADNGLQVQPTTFVGCFIAINPAGRFDFRLWGAVSTNSGLPSIASGATDAAPFIRSAFLAGVPLTCSGYYDLASSVALANNVSLKANLGSCTLYPDPTAPAGNAQIFTGNTLKNVVISGVVFDGNSSAQFITGTRQIFINGCNNVTFDNIVVQNANSVGGAVSGSTIPITNCVVQNSKFDNIGNYWKVTGNPDIETAWTFIGSTGETSSNVGNVFRNNTLTNIGGDGVDLQGQLGLMITENHFNFFGTNWIPSTSAQVTSTGYGSACAYAPGGFGSGVITTDTFFINNYCNGPTGPGFAGGAGYITISGNHFTAPGGSCVQFGAISTAFSGINITDNFCINPYQSANYAFPNVNQPGGFEIFCSFTCNTVSNLIIARNITIDDQTTPTAAFGIYVSSGITLGGGINIAPDNIIQGIPTAAPVGSGPWQAGRGPWGGQLTGPKSPIASSGVNTDITQLQTLAGIRMFSATAGVSRPASWYTGSTQLWSLAILGSNDATLALNSYNISTGTYLSSPFIFNSSTLAIGRNWYESAIVNSAATTAGGVVGSLGTYTNTGGYEQQGAKIDYKTNGGQVNAAAGGVFDIASTHILTATATTLPATGSGKTPTYLADWAVDIGPNLGTGFSWAMQAYEVDLVNRSADYGLRTVRSGTANNMTGIVVVPEATTFGTGGSTFNSDWAFVASRSAGNGTSGIPNAWYVGYLVDPDSVVGTTGYGAFFNGDSTSTTARVPYSPFGVGYTWLHGFDLTAATLSDGYALRMATAQGLAWLASGTATASIGTINSGASISLLPTGTGNVVVGAGTALATTATGGFLALPFANGTPTGTPGSRLGPNCVWNDTSRNLDCYSPSASVWYHVAFTSGAN